MPVAPSTDSQLERAYVEAEVIRSGLQHLAARLDNEESNPGDDLRDCTERFDAYMRELRTVCERAETHARHEPRNRMAVTTYTAQQHAPPSPHTWQTSLPACAIRRTGRYWVMTRHVEHFCRPLTIEGREHLRDIGGPALIIANHSSHFDTPVVLSTLPDPLRAKTAVAAAADKFYRPGKRGWWFSLFWNAYPIERGAGRDALAYSADLLSRGWSLLMYPEGTRSRSGAVAQFRHGAAILAMQANAPVIPIYTEGLRDVMPKGERVPRPAAVRVRIGEPVKLDGVSSVEAATLRLQGALYALSLSAIYQRDPAAEAMSGVR